MALHPDLEAHHQPKIFQKMLLRFAIGLFILAALFFGYQWFNRNKDVDYPATVDTAGEIAALQITDEGTTQAVIVSKEGELIPSPGYVPGVTEKQIAWRPDGNRLLFVSDREEKTFHIYRWNPGSNVVARRSFGSTSQNKPYFDPAGKGGNDEPALIIAGGRVLELDPKTAATRQVLPPVGKERSQDEEGAVGQFDQMYERLGKSFESAKWGKDRKTVVAVMGREDESQVLIIQDMTGNEPPTPVIAGDHVEFDVNPTTGDVVYAVYGARFPDTSSLLGPFVAAERKALSQVMPNFGTPSNEEEKQTTDRVERLEKNLVDKCQILYSSGNYMQTTASKFVSLYKQHEDALVGLFPETNRQALRKALEAERPKLDYAWHSAIGVVGSQGGGLMVRTPDKSIRFQQIAISPEGSNVLYVSAKMDADGNFSPTDLFVGPMTANAGPLRRVISGGIYEPSWHPNSNTIAFVKRNDEGKRAVQSINKDGSGLTDITGNKGDFASPIFSPQSN